MAADLRALGDIRLPVFLREAGLELEDLYAGPERSFSALREAAGLTRRGARENTDRHDALMRALPRLLYVDDDARLDRWRQWLSQSAPPRVAPDDPMQLMFFAALGFVRRPVSELGAALADVWALEDVRHELLDLLELLADRRRRPTFALDALPFRVHGTYSRDEVSAGLREVRKGKLLRTQGGVYKCEQARSDVLYVELDKDPKHYTPTTLYEDRFLSATRFHWESQSKTRADSDTGRRYRNHAQMNWRILLFVRQRAEDDRGFTSPYLFLGPVDYASHESEKPMKIVWNLQHPAPPEFFSTVKIAAG